MRVFAYIKGVNAIVLTFFAAAVVNAAAGHNQHIAALANVEIIVYQIGKPAFGNNHGNMHALLNRVRGNVDIYAILIGFYTI